MTVLGINFTDREPDRFEWQHHSHCCDATLNELNAADAAYVKIVDTGTPAEMQPPGNTARIARRATQPPGNDGSRK